MDGYDDGSSESAVTFTRLEPTAEACALEVRGDLDIAVSGALSYELEELLSRGNGRIDLDLSGVTFIDSSALRILVQTHERAQQLGRELSLLSPSPACIKVLNITRLDRVFTVR